MTTINLVDLSALPDDLRAKVEATCPTERGAVVWKPESHYKSLDALERLPEEFRTRRVLSKLTDTFYYDVYYDSEPESELERDIPRETDILFRWFPSLMSLFVVIVSVIQVVNREPQGLRNLAASFLLFTLFATFYAHKLSRHRRLRRLQKIACAAVWAYPNRPIPFTHDELDTITAARMTFDGDDPECVMAREADSLLRETSAMWKRSTRPTRNEAYSALRDYMGWSTSARTALSLECAKIRDLRAKGEPIDESLWELSKKRLKSMTEYRDKARVVSTNPFKFHPERFGDATVVGNGPA